MNKLGVSDKACACGCGENLVIAKRNLYRAELPKYISGHNAKTPDARKAILGILHSADARKKASETMKRKYRDGSLFVPSRKGLPSPTRGTNMSEAAKKHLSVLNAGKKHSPETKEKLRRIAKENGSGKHMLGRRLSDDTKRKISVAHIGIMPKNMSMPGKFMNIKRGYYLIGQKETFFRSKWEANYALYLEFLKERGEILNWEYEKDVFTFDKIKFGTRSYRPDFKLLFAGGGVEYHEIKGWQTPRSKTQLNRMRIYYPKVRLVLIAKKEYTKLVSSLGKVLKFY